MTTLKKASLNLTLAVSLGTFTALCMTNLASAAAGDAPGVLAQAEAFIAFFAPYFAIPFAFKLAGGLAATISGAVNDRSRGGFDRLKNFRGQQTSKNMRNLKAGSRWNPESRATKLLGGSLINRAGAQVGGFAATGRAWGRANQNARAGNAYADKGGMAKENQFFAHQMENEGAMAALAMGGNRSRMAKLKHYQNEDGSANWEKIDTDIGAARPIGFNRRTQNAGADALSQSGKIIKDRDDAELLYRTVAGGNASAYQGIKGQYQYNSRKAGRQDIGRSSDFDMYKELKQGDIGSQKPDSMQNMFGNRTVRNSDGTTHTYNPLVEQLKSGQGGAEHQQHLVDLLHGAQYNTYTSAEQQVQIGNAIEQVKTLKDSKGNNIGEALWSRAQQNYNAKYSSKDGGKRDDAERMDRDGH